MIKTYITFLEKNRGYSQATLKAYATDLRLFAAWAKSNTENPRWSCLQQADFEHYVADLYNDGQKASSVTRKVSAIRAFYTWMMGRGLMSTNPARFVSSPKIPKTAPKTVEMAAIRAALTSNAVSLTTKVQIAIMTEAGLRLQETLDLTTEDIDRELHAIHVTGKGAKDRTTYYGPETARLLRDYIPNGYTGKLFIQTQRETRAAVYAALKPFSHAQQLSPHALRHTFATNMLNNGASLETIEQLLGHESVQTTERYARMGSARSRDEYNNYAPQIATAKELELWPKTA